MTATIIHADFRAARQWHQRPCPVGRPYEPGTPAYAPEIKWPLRRTVFSVAAGCTAFWISAAWVWLAVFRAMAR